jgi:hypothetical protein
MDTGQPKRRTWRQRFCQISLRTIVVVMALVCMGAAVYGWRVRRENELVALVVEFNAAFDDGEYPKAIQIANRAIGRFPHHPIPICMLEKGRYALEITAVRRH